jgi:hypothetical protein
MPGRQPLLLLQSRPRESGEGKPEAEKGPYGGAVQRRPAAAAAQSLEPNKHPRRAPRPVVPAIRRRDRTSGSRSLAGVIAGAIQPPWRRSGTGEATGVAERGAANDCSPNGKSQLVVLGACQVAQTQPAEPQRVTTVPTPRIESASFPPRRLLEPRSMYRMPPRCAPGYPDACTGNLYCTVLQLWRARTAAAVGAICDHAPPLRPPTLARVAHGTSRLGTIP